MFFFVITKNLNLEILTKNLVNFKRWDGIKDEKFEYYGGSLKNPIFRGGGGAGFTKTNIWGQGLKKGELRQFVSAGFKFYNYTPHYYQFRFETFSSNSFANSVAPDPWLWEIRNIITCIHCWRIFQSGLQLLLAQPITCQCCPLIETSANQLTGFYVMATLALNGLRLLPFWVIARDN